MRKCVSCLAAVATVATVVSVAGFGYPARAATSAPNCAWQYSSSMMNADWPDSNAEYWLTPFTLQADLKIIVHGVYPVARYFSITAYNSLGTASTSNVIHDTQIAPSADGSYTVTISHDVRGRTLFPLPMHSTAPRVI